MKILIVSPHFPPTNAADMQRVRLLLPYFEEHGVGVEVLAVEPEQVAAPLDPWLVEGLPADIPVHRVRAMGLHWRKLPGLGTLAFRALGALNRKGSKLLASRRFDLVYFSTTQFGTISLGPLWKRRFTTPFVIDYQDPWVNDYYQKNPTARPPGGTLKYGLARALAKFQEPRVLRECSGVTAVSPSYPHELARRYPTLLEQSSSTMPHLVAPFPGDDRDLLRVRSGGIRQVVFDPNDNLAHWVYVGRGGQDMETAVEALFVAFRRALNSERFREALERVKMHFVGTSYAAPGRGKKTIAPIAEACGIADFVEEHPDRIAYSQTLQCLLEADALLVPGSNDPGYTASKIYPYLLARKPLLAIFHESSSVMPLIDRVGGAIAVPFTSADNLADRVFEAWFESKHWNQTIPLNDEAFVPFSAKTQAQTLVDFFRHCISR